MVSDVPSFVQANVWRDCSIVLGECRSGGRPGLKTRRHSLHPRQLMGRTRTTLATPFGQSRFQLSDARLSVPQLFFRVRRVMSILTSLIGPDATPARGTVPVAPGLPAPTSVAGESVASL